MPYFNIVAETNENTVVTTYEPLPKRPEVHLSYDTLILSRSKASFRYSLFHDA